jgi:NAD(P)-dependent dehydrogenase (short-subunit alcohol dehydrogenase family)
MADQHDAGTLIAGKHAVVTGGGGGIGAAIARRLHAHGAEVTVMGRSSAPLESIVGELSGAAYQIADVADAVSVEQAFANAVADKGDVAVLINSAGAAKSASFSRTSESLWEEMLGVNLTGMFHCQKQVVLQMKKAGFGRIVNIVSTAGLIGYAYVAAYCAAKHGAIGLTRALALETAREGITVNAVCPGFTATDLLEDSLKNIMDTTGRSREEAERSLQAVNPQRRFIQPDEIAATVSWLCAPGSESVTGQAIAIAGGEVM